MVAGWRPEVIVQAAWNADPNDPAAVPTWSDLTALFLAASGIKHGKQYELDQTQGAQPTLNFLDPNENLNPGNPSSPYASGLFPLRQILFQGIWPNPCSGNLLNTKTQGQAYDCSLESYTAGTTPAWVSAVGGTSPTVQAANPHGGTKSLQYAVAGGATIQGISATLPCVPGRQYTASIWVRQSSASTQQIAVTGVAAGTSTATTGSYVRLTVTFTATQPWHTLTVQTTGTAVAGTVNLDDLQHEQGASASANTTTGSVIYGVLRDYVERLPSEWDQDTRGFLGLCDMGLVDAFAPLEGVDLWTEYRNAVLAKKPDYYWPLDEAQGASLFAECSGNSGPPLNRTNSKYGAAATFTPGTQTNIAGDPSGTGVLINSGATGSNTALTVIQTGLYNQTPPVSIASVTEPWSATWAWWVSHSAVTAGTAIFGRATDPTFNANSFEWLATSTQLTFNTVTVTDSWADSKPHLFVGVTTLTSSQVTDTLYVDGTQVGTATTLGVFFNALNTLIELGADISLGTSRPGLPNATYAHVAVWNRALSVSEITDLNNAGKGYPGENSGARIARYLGYAWSGTSAVDTGQSAMGASNLAAKTSLLAACQAVTTSENGNFFADATGRVVFQSRTRRYFATTPAYTFGERTDLGEFPYLGDIKFEYDLTQILNDISVTRSGGIIAAASDTASQKRFFPRGYQRTINVASDLEAQDATNWILGTHKTPAQRIDQITLDPVGYPALWPVVLGLELGTRVTSKKRSPAANNGAGLTQTGDFFVESIEHTNVDLEAGTWQTVLQLSPATPALQPWILGDSTYGQLGVTTVLGY